MEVVACFLKKYFTLIAEEKVQATKELYDEKATVCLTINGQTESAMGPALVEKIVALFANGITTITDVQVVSSADAIVLSADGFVDINGAQTSFSQHTTLFHAAKQWYIASDRLKVSVPDPVAEEPAQEPPVAVAEVPAPVVATPEPEPEPVKKETPTPKKGKAAVAALAANLAPTPAAEPKPVVPKPAASGWAAIAASAPTGEKPKVATIVNVATSPVAVEKPAPKAILPTLACVHFALNTSNNPAFEKVTEVAKQKEIILQDLVPLMEKAGINKEDVKDVRVSAAAPHRSNVFIDFSIADACEKLQSLVVPTIKGARIMFAPSNKK